MPVGSEGLPYTRYRVLRPVEAEIGPASAVPEFGATGGATQYLLDLPVKELVRRGLSGGLAVRPSIEAQCPVCGGIIEVPYTLLGAPIACPACDETVVPEVPVATAYPETAYEIIFLDFQQLVREMACRPAISELLARWFDYEISGKGESQSCA